MFFSHPESDLQNNAAVLGITVIELLKKKRGYVLIEMLLAEFQKTHGYTTTDSFFDTLTFLFAVSIIESKGYKIKLIQQ